MNCIDAHTHIFSQYRGFGYRGEAAMIGEGRARWATGEEFTVLADGAEKFTAEHLIQLMDQNDVKQAVILQGSYLGFCNEEVFKATQIYPDRLFGMGTFDPCCVEYRLIMERQIDAMGFKGFKFEISQNFGLMGYHSDFRLNNARMVPIWEFADARCLVISLDLGTFDEPSMQIAELSAIAQKYRNIRFVVEHIFFPGQNQIGKVSDGLETLRHHDNIYFTAASIPLSTGPQAYPFSTACRVLEIAKNIVGTDRILWGSDAPTVLVHFPYMHLRDYIRDSGIFSGTELEKVYCSNAKTVYEMT